MKDRKVYLVMCYHYNHKSTYVSEACTTQKKADKYREYISKVMNEHDPENPRDFWIYEVKVS